MINTWEKISALSLLLAIFSSLQIFVTGIFALAFSEVLLLTSSEIRIAFGLLAGLIAIPTSLRLKLIESSTKAEKIFGYTICYQEMSIVVCLLINSIACATTACGLIATPEYGEAFTKLLYRYETNLKSKMLIDDIQIVLQCCGSQSYEDWFKIHGKNRIENVEYFLGLKSINENHSVPYSCCIHKTLLKCKNENISNSDTINTNGCSSGIKKWTRKLWGFLFGLYFLNLLFEVALLVILLPMKSVNEGMRT